MALLVRNCNTVMRSNRLENQIVISLLSVWLKCCCLIVAGVASEPNPSRTTHAIVAGFERFSNLVGTDFLPTEKLLLTELNCTACHSSQDPVLVPRLGPNMDGIGSRIDADWMFRFLMEPQKTKPGTRMPDPLAFLDGDSRADAAKALVSFLANQTSPFPELKASGVNPVLHEFYDRGDPQRGERQYHTIGCIACHEPSKDYELVGHRPSELDRLLEALEPEEIIARGLSSIAVPYASIPLPNLSQKYSNQSLAYFLLNPEQHNSTSIMPNFGLLPSDAADMVSWLRARDSANGVSQVDVDWQQAVRDPLLVERGRRLFVDFQCAQCHKLKDALGNQMAIPLKQLNLSSAASCISSVAPSEPRSKSYPWYSLNELQRKAIRKAINSDVPPPKELEFRLLQWNCYACHERQSLGGVGQSRKPYFETVNQIDLGDEGRLPPSLTKVGQKLTQEGMKKILDGSSKLRPHMTIRMPRYVGPTYRNLAPWFAAEDGASERNPFPELIANRNHAELVEAGRKLMDIGCVQCHSFRGETLPGVVGVELEGVSKRLHPNWFQEFLKDPSRWKARTRMPNFFPDGKSQVPDLLEGNVSLQIAAMHLYLNELTKQQLPDKLETVRSQTYELKPIDRPIVFRTFMQDVGLHAIAVGLPESVHYAWDAETAGLASVWRGRFLDAQGTWLDRFAPLAQPVGDDKKSFVQGPTYTSLFDLQKPWPIDSDKASVRFLGYRLDQQGLPTFRIRVSECEVEETIRAQGNGLKRSVTFHLPQEAIASKQTTFLRIHASKKWKSTDNSSSNLDTKSITDLSGLRLRIPENARTITRVSQGQMEWIMVCDLKQGETQSWEILYQW